MSDFTPEEYRAMLYKFTELDSKDRERIFGCCFLVNVVEKYAPNIFMKKMKEFIGTPKPFEIWKHKSHNYKVVVLRVEDSHVYVIHFNNYFIHEDNYMISKFPELFEKVGDSEGFKKLIQELK